MKYSALYHVFPATFHLYRGKSISFGTVHKYCTYREASARNVRVAGAWSTCHYNSACFSQESNRPPPSDNKKWGERQLREVRKVKEVIDMRD